LRNLFEERMRLRERELGTSRGRDILGRRRY
jgi:hypothetical protein